MPSKLLSHGRCGSPARRGLTLVEMLISMTVSLIMIYAMLRFFGDLMANVADGRAAIEMSGQLRSAADRLHEDLRGVTVPVRPWTDPASGLGYFEYVENAGHDYQPMLWLNGTAPFPPDPTLSAFGDVDDVIAFTTRSSGRPFIGQYRVQATPGGAFAAIPSTTDSHYAEVVWWTRWFESPTGIPDVLEPGEVTLYRRVLLVRPDMGLVASIDAPDANSSNYADWQTFRDELNDFYQNTDISVRPEVTVSSGTVTIRFWANSLADLTKRENRFCHRPILYVDPSSGNTTLIDDSMLVGAFPYALSLLDGSSGRGNYPSLYELVQSGDQEGEDVMLSHATAFDVKAFDPTASVTANRTDPSLVSELLVPSDPGYGDVTTVVSQGTYVDLAYNVYLTGNKPSVSVTSLLSDPPLAPTSPAQAFPNNWSAGTAVYDTWPFHYEQDGVTQNGGSLIDEGTNGIDDNGVGGVDDPSERETQAPYNVPLRGIKVSLRMIEPDSRQVKQLSVINDFTPE